MKVLIAPDKFKGTLTSVEAAEAIRRGVLARWPGASCTVVPIADGGEGTLEALWADGARRVRARVRGPRDEEVDADWVLRPDGTAVLESARACGLALVAPGPSPASSLSCHSFGVGQLICAALDAGARRIVVGLGGSACTDGGSGALRALGAEVRGGDGRPVDLGGGALGSAATLGLASLDPRLRETEIVVATDVTAPLTGPAGAVRLFAPQKGADAAAVAVLEDGLRHWGELLVRAGHAVDFPGAGAAGGLGAGLMAASPRARVRAGFALVEEQHRLPELIARHDLVITGEGSLDEQSRQGKGPWRVAELARRAGVSVLIVAGRVSPPPQRWRRPGLEVVSLTDVAGSAEAAQGDPVRWIAEALRGFTW
ncbi:MAG TPA: glycerate kinase, partial [Arachnia sp.]|nr:glycerate kinase [Arachnia sp.]HMT87507.1 glycerate kinase [Arachnia sp.]